MPKVLKDLVGKPEAKRVLKNVHFDWESPEVSYTTPSVGGAASGLNDAYILKANKAEEKDLNESEVAILEAISEEFTPLQKCDKSDTKSPSLDSTVGKAGEDTKPSKGTDKMSEEVLKELALLRHENASIKLEKQLASFELADEATVALADSLASLDKAVQETVIKALGDVKAAGEAKVEVAVAKAKEAAPEGETELQKALAGEAGVTGEPEADVAKSFLEKIAAHQDKGAK